MSAVSPAHAANVAWAYSASTGGTYVHLADGTVTSDLTASSNISGSTNSTKSVNSTAAGKVGTLGTAGAVQTKTTAAATASKTTINGWARTAGVNLLGGLIRANAITTDVTSWAKSDGTSGISSASSQIAGLKISGIKVPVNIPKNWHVRIPGIATISANFSKHATNGGTAATLGWALNVTLLQKKDGMPAGAVIVVNPVNQYFMQGVPGAGTMLQGAAMATQVKANVGGQLKLASDPVAYIATPFGSSHGTTLVNDTAKAHVGSGLNTLLNAAAVRSTSWSTADPKGNAEIRNISTIAGLNLLGGLIKADAIKVVAHSKLQNGKWTHNQSMTLANLVIAGKKIPLTVKPNTTLNIANLGKVVLNKQVANAKTRTNGIFAVQITLNTARAGLQAGSEIDLAAAATEID
ncbi:MAG: hypothetical protein FWE71_05290 [Nocardioidaceae bacterium]|nr:hypothetical protein [Nocardioidaceae bacterium]MCL2612042.1 hypothetical protein [Nocardioidaceae bacterium]